VYLLGCGGGGGSSDPVSPIDPTPEVTPTPHPVGPVNTAGLPNFGEVAPGLTRSGQPTAQGFYNLSQAGVNVILKLNMEQELGTPSVATVKKEFSGEVWYQPINFMAIDCNVASQIVDELEARLQEGQFINIQCTRGVDRTALIANLWEMRYGGKTHAQIHSEWGKYGTPEQAVQDCLAKY